MRAAEGRVAPPVSAYLGEIAVMAGLVAVAVFFYAEAPNQPPRSVADPGAAFFPELVASIMVGLIVVRLVHVVWRRPPPEKSEGKHWRLLITMWAAIVAYPLLWNLGYIPATLAFVVVTMLAAGNRSWKTLAISAIAYTAGSFFVFNEMLNVRLP